MGTKKLEELQEFQKNQESWIMKIEPEEPKEEKAYPEEDGFYIDHENKIVEIFHNWDYDPHNSDWIRTGREQNDQTS